MIVQKSFKEGFGLTITEAMWKAKPVVATAVGGVKEQIEDGISGILLKDPRDLAAFGEALVRPLGDSELAHRLGRLATERVRQAFLNNRHIVQYLDLLKRVA